MTCCQLLRKVVFNLCEMVRGHEAQLIIVHSTCHVRCQPESRGSGKIWWKHKWNGWKVNLGNHIGRSDMNSVKVEVKLRSVPSPGDYLLDVKQAALQKQGPARKKKEKSFSNMYFVLFPWSTRSYISHQTNQYSVQDTDLHCAYWLCWCPDFSYCITMMLTFVHLNEMS